MSRLKNITTRAACSSLIVLVLSFQAKLPEGRHRYGSDPAAYMMKVDSTAGHTKNGRALTIKSLLDTIAGYGTLLMAVDAKPFLGKKIALSGWLKSTAITERGGLWLRINSNEKTVGFDNMSGRPLRGDSDWTYYRLVLPVDRKAWKIEYGITLNGMAQICSDCRLYPCL